MRAVVQRVSEAKVEVDGEAVGAIGDGLLALVGVGHDDTEAVAAELAHKLVHLRIFEDEEGRMNRSVLDVGGALCVVSQFTLYGSFAKGNKPDLHRAMPPGPAKALYETFLAAARAAVLPPGGDDAAAREKVKDGVFGANMQVALVNDGPVTMLLDSQDRKG